MKTDFLTDLKKQEPLNIKKLLAQAIYNFRFSSKTAYEKNVASTLFVYQGKIFNAIAADSGGQKVREEHSERRSLFIAIQAAVSNEWEPFSEIDPKSRIIPDFMKVSDLQAHQSLFSILQQVEIHIYSERPPCDFRANFADKNPDKGCAPYFEAVTIQHIELCA
jgi:hypothetical protein